MEKEKPNLDEIFGAGSDPLSIISQGWNKLERLTEAEQKEYDSLYIERDEIIHKMLELGMKLYQEKIIDTERYKSVRTEIQMMYAINSVIRSLNGIMEYRIKKYYDEGWYWGLSESIMKDRKCVFKVKDDEGVIHYIRPRGDTWSEKMRFMIYAYIKVGMKMLWLNDNFMSEGYECVFFYKRKKRMWELEELNYKRINEKDGKNRL